ncbi:uncharacterized protein LOC111501293 [Maylandia zebra]|uniref:uncharacterized protein LOC111501293 n=1 Tax=Maylandia zebra TaxID=106582 RepID=UPI00403CCFCA
MKNDLPETGKDCTLALAEIEKNTTGIGVTNEKATMIVTGTDGTTKTVTTASTGIVSPFLDVTTGNGRPIVTGSKPSSTLGSVIATGALTITTATGQERTLTMSEGDMVTPTERSLVAVGGGCRIVKTPGQLRIRVMAKREKITPQRKEISHLLQHQKQTSSRARLSSPDKEVQNRKRTLGKDRDDSSEARHTKKHKKSKKKKKSKDKDRHRESGSSDGDSDRAAEMKKKKKKKRHRDSDPELHSPVL